MPAGTSAVFSAISASEAAAASAAAARAEQAKCVVVMNGYSPHEATVDQMREYAACVRTLYPEPLGAEWVVGFKVVFAIALIGMSIGIINAVRDHDDWFDTMMGGFVGFVVAPMAALIVAILGAGIYWLAT